MEGRDTPSAKADAGLGDTWETSPEYMTAHHLWIINDWVDVKFEQSQEFRNARLAYKKRVNGGYTKGSH